MKKPASLLIALILTAIPACAEYYVYEIPLTTLTMKITLPEDYLVFLPEFLEDDQFISDAGELVPIPEDLFSDETLAAYMMAYTGEFDLYISESEDLFFGSQPIDGTSMKIAGGILDFFSRFTDVESPDAMETVECLNHTFMKVAFDNTISYMTQVNHRAAIITVIPTTESGEISPSRQMILQNILDSVYICE